MNKYLKAAAKAWAGATLDIKKFADAYMSAIERFGDAAEERFMAAFPMFGKREWNRLSLIGDGKLLPQFFFKSDFFVNKLLRLNDMRVQKALVGASGDGTIRIDRGNGPEKARLSDLTRREDKSLMMLLSEENEKLSACELRSKFKTMIAKINKSNRRPRPAWEIREASGNVVVHFNRACSLGVRELEDVLEAAKRRESKGNAKKTSRTSREMLRDLVKAVKELEDMRDAEWGFADERGHDSAFWTDKDERQHQWILDSIQACREEVQALAREATGDSKLEI